MKMIVKRCYVYWRKACQITSGKFEAFGRIDFRYDRGEKLILSQHGIHHNLFFNMGFFPFWWCFFSQHAMSESSYQILSESYQTKRNRQGIFKGKNRPPTHRFIFPSTVAVPCLSMLKASKNPRKYRPVLRTQGNQSLLFELFVLSGCCWLLFLDFVVVSCLVFGLAILLHYVLLACWVEASKDAKDGKKTLPNYVPSQPWFLLTAKLSSNPILGSSSQTWRRIKNPQKTGFQQKTKLHPFIDLKGNHPSPAYNCSPQPSSSAWSQAPDFVQHKAWIKWSVQHKLPEP